MKKTSFLMLLTSLMLAFSCQKRPYGTFQKTPSSNAVSSDSAGRLAVAPLEVHRPPTLSEETETINPLEIVESNAIIDVPSKKVDEQSTILKQNSSSTGEKKKFKQVTKWEANAGSTVKDYKLMGILSAILGTVAYAFVFFALKLIIAVPPALTTAGIVGLLALITGFSSVKKLKGMWKILPIIGIIGGIAGVFAGLVLLLIIIAFAWF